MGRLHHPCVAVLCLLAVVPAELLADGLLARGEQLEFDPRSGEWSVLASPQPGTPEGDLALARQHLLDGDAGKARRALRVWLKDYGHDQALSRSAILALAEAELAMKNYHKAHRLLQELISELGGDDVTQRAGEVEFVIAEAFLTGVRRKFWGMRLLPASDLGIEILDSLGQRFVDSQLGEWALRAKANYYFARGDFDLAEDEYGRMMSEHPQSPYWAWALAGRAQAALAQFPGIRFDDAPLVEAEERFLRYRQDYPQAAQQEGVDQILEDIRNTRAQKEFEIGEYYRKADRLRAAVFYYRSVVGNWPDTISATQAERVLEQMGQAEPVLSAED